MQLVVNQWVLDARNVKPPNHLPPAGPRSQTASSQHCVCALPRSRPSALPQRLIGHNYTAELSLSQSLHRGERDPPMGPDLRHKATGGVDVEPIGLCQEGYWQEREVVAVC